MSNEDPERLARILIVYFKQFKSIKFDDSLHNKGFDQVLPVRMTVEHQEVELPANLAKALELAIEKGIDEEKHVAKFCSLMEMYSELFGSSKTEGSRFYDSQFNLSDMISEIKLNKPAAEKVQK